MLVRNKQRTPSIAQLFVFFAIEARYPDLGSGKIPAKKFSKSDAKNFLKIASEVLKCIKEIT